MYKHDSLEPSYSDSSKLSSWQGHFVTKSFLCDLFGWNNIQLYCALKKNSARNKKIYFIL